MCEGGDAIDIDLGDVVASFNVHVKGRRHHRLRLRIGPPGDTTPQDRVVNTQPITMFQRKAGTAMDLQADKKVTLTAEWTDEVGNPTGSPADADVQWTTDNPGVINLTDNGDGTAVAAATGVVGSANVHCDATGDGNTLAGDLQINVVAGLAERIAITAGEPEEVTPDDGTGPEPQPEPQPEPTPEP